MQTKKNGNYSQNNAKFQLFPQHALIQKIGKEHCISQDCFWLKATENLTLSKQLNTFNYFKGQEVCDRKF